MGRYMSSINRIREPGASRSINKMSKIKIDVGPAAFANGPIAIEKIRRNLEQGLSLHGELFDQEAPTFIGHYVRVAMSVRTSPKPEHGCINVPVAGDHHFSRPTMSGNRG